MKRLLFVVLACGLAAAGFSQYLPYSSVRGKGQHAYAKMVKTSIGNINIPGQQQPNEYVSNLKSVLTDPTLFNSYYDLQTNASSGQQRIYQFPDGTLGGVGTMSLTSTGTSWPDRGTGYNYYNGTTWGTLPTVRVETGVRTGWPSYQPWGATGECILAHQFPTGNLQLSTRPVKGTGAWTTTNNLVPPSSVPAMAWPRMITNGTDHMNIHVIAVTEPTANGGVVYNGMDGALCYARSTDGGATWSAWQQLPGTASTDYIAISADVYAWAMPHGDTLAFVCGDNFTDEFLMKSTDNGTTWTKTIIFPNPYNLVGFPGTQGDPGFFNPDGTSACALDYYGNAHVCFGIQWDSATATGANYLPNCNGLVYWNESMPQILDLNPDSVYNHGNLIAWQQDTTVFWAGGSAPLPFASYYTSLTSNPGILIDQNDDMFVIWSSVTHWKDISPLHLYMRHVFQRIGHIYSDGSFWFHSDMSDLTHDYVYNFLECMYADISQSSYDDQLHILFQGDTYAGSFVKSLNNPNYVGQTVGTINSFIVLNIQQPVWIGEKKNNNNITLTVSPNWPNPFTGTTSVTVSNLKPGNMSIGITNIVGQSENLIDYGYINAGSNNYIIDGNRLLPGVYFYTIYLDKESVTKKMVVE